MKIFYRFDPPNDYLFFGESAAYYEEVMNDKEQAREYLRLWKHFLMRKLNTELSNHELIDEQWIDRAPMYAGPFEEQWTLSLKLAFKKKLPYQL